jgi:preprotein translocase subunit SecD
VAPPTGTLRVGRYFAALIGILVVLYGIAMWPGDKHTPKLGIDLVGGTQAVFTARAEHGKTPTASAMNQAKAIMEDRVNSTGVTEATVVVQGSDQLVVSIPGGTNTDVEKLGAAAKLNFRGLVAPAAASSCGLTSSYGGNLWLVKPTNTVTPTTVAAAFTAAKQPLAHAPAERSFGGTKYIVARFNNPASGPPIASTAVTTTTSAVAKTLKLKTTDVQAAPLCAKDPFHYVTDPKSKTYDKALTTLLSPCTGTTPNAALIKCQDQQPAGKATIYGTGALTSAQLSTISSLLPTFDCAQASDEEDLNNNYYVACDYGSQTKTSNLVYLLGPVVVAGTQIDSASAQAPNGTTAQWTVSLSLKSKGDSNWSAYTGAHNIGGAASNSGATTSCSETTTPCTDFVGFTLDGKVINAPVNESQISGLPTQITGQFTPSEAKDLARELNYGALPLTFKAENAQHVSASLGNSQLKASFIAGGIGLALVILYSLIYYRLLGTITIASLIVSAGLTYASLVFLGRQIGFTLDLAGIAGFIVALGITADSFVVFFERLKDEVHEGRSVRVAVPRAWVRARRTILSADTVSFLAAAILYYFASADVKGFAFTLGMSTILDLVVVFLFTHPIMSVLSRVRAFGSPRWTGLDSLRGSTLPPDDAEPPRRPKRVVEPEPAAKRFEGAATISRPTVVLKKDDVPEVDVTDEVGPDESVSDEIEPDEAPAERRRTTPQPGSAAERAAARRAKLRANKDGGER